MPERVGKVPAMACRALGDIEGRGALACVLRDAAGIGDAVAVGARG